MSNKKQPASKTKAEKILIRIAWLWPFILIPLCVLLALTNCSFPIKELLFLGCICMVLLPLILSAIASMREKPKIKPRCWKKVFLINLLWLVVLFVSASFASVLLANDAKPVIYLYPKETTEVFS